MTQFSFKIDGIQCWQEGKGKEKNIENAFVCHFQVAVVVENRWERSKKNFSEKKTSCWYSQSLFTSPSFDFSSILFLLSLSLLSSSRPSSLTLVYFGRIQDCLHLEDNGMRYIMEAFFSIDIVVNVKKGNPLEDKKAIFLTHNTHPTKADHFIIFYEFIYLFLFYDFLFFSFPPLTEFFFFSFSPSSPLEARSNKINKEWKIPSSSSKVIFLRLCDLIKYFR